MIETYTPKSFFYSIYSLSTGKCLEYNREINLKTAISSLRMAMVEYESKKVVGYISKRDIHKMSREDAFTHTIANMYKCDNSESDSYKTPPQILGVFRPDPIYIIQYYDLDSMKIKKFIVTENRHHKRDVRPEYIIERCKCK